MKLIYCFGDRAAGKSYLMNLLYGATHTLLTTEAKKNKIKNYRRKMSFDKYLKLEEDRRPRKIIIDDEKIFEIKNTLRTPTTELVTVYPNLDALDYILNYVKMNNYERTYTYTSARGRIHILHFWCLID